MKQRHVLREMLGGVAFGIERNEQRLHALGVVAKLLHRQPDLLQISRADVGAVGEAEIDQYELATEVGIGADFSGLIVELERAADRLAIPHHRIHQFSGESR